MAKQLSVQLLLPNRQKERFNLSANSDLQQALCERLLNCFPDAIGVEFVEKLPAKVLKSGGLFETAVMFQLRERYYTLGHLIIQPAR